MTTYQAIRPTRTTDERPRVERCDVAVVGAGPYGLAAAAHLNAADGLCVRVFGETMAFWERQMPAGMLLRSPREASHISDADGAFTLDRYEDSLGVPHTRPVPLERFVAYGRWFQSRAVPDVDERRVEQVRPTGHGFELELADGERIAARRVVLAGGIAPYAWTPPEFAHLPCELASHASVHANLQHFRGRSVVVIGGGQSALESAALLHEVGADVEVLVRADHVNWLVRSSRLHRLAWMRRLLYAPADIGPAGISWLVATPRAFKLLPMSAQVPIARRSIRPAGSAWLVPRLADVPIRTSHSVVRARRVGDRVQLELDGGVQRTADHIFLGTGYRIDLSRLGLLSPELTSALKLAGGYPVLDRSFQSSVPGLYVAGAAAAYSFGPLMRFVAGTGFAARALTRGIVASHRRSR